MSFDESGKSASLAGSDDMNFFIGVEHIHKDFIPEFQLRFAFGAHFAQNSYWRGIGFLKMPTHGLVHVLRFDELHES